MDGDNALPAPAAPADHPTPPVRSADAAGHKRLLYGTALTAGGGALMLTALWAFNMLPEKATLGDISIDTPEIYTRERLVNDRYLQEAWLTDELDRESKNFRIRQHAIEERRTLSILNTNKSESSAGSEPSNQKTQNQDSNRQPSSRDVFLQGVDHRETIRNLIIENQLDDRHDLNGNTLHKFKFDTSILPGTNTSASARIDVELVKPDFINYKDASIRGLEDVDNESLDKWKNIYLKWVNNLSARLNQQHNELRRNYYNNEFTHNEYARLITFINKSLENRFSQTTACKRDAYTTINPEQDKIQLTPAEHKERKNCIRSIFDTIILTPKYSASITPPPPPNATANADQPSSVGTYISQTLSNTPTLNKERLTEAAFNFILNTHLASTTLRLVLGVKMPDILFIQGTYQTPSALKELLKIALLNPDFAAGETLNVFSVQPRIERIEAFDAENIDENKMTEYWIKRYYQNQPAGNAHKMVQESFANSEIIESPSLKLRVISRALNFTKDENIEVNPSSFKEVAGYPGFYEATIEAGLLNFIRKINESSNTYTYSATPKDSFDNVSMTVNADMDTVGDIAPINTSDKLIRLRAARSLTSMSYAKRARITGFSNGMNHGNAHFGWLISPNQPRFDGTRHTLVQEPGQYSLSALVSIPSWWSNVHFKVTKKWIATDGSIAWTSATTEYDIELPNDYEQLETNFLKNEQIGPELIESRLDNINLTACRPGRIVIPGRRLWRSTKVMLGDQAADSITVLPNMKGIIASFNKIENQAGIKEITKMPKNQSIEISRTVTVWTSQGFIALPGRARIGITQPDKACKELEVKIESKQ